jgi:hypothetical protein
VRHGILPLEHEQIAGHVADDEQDPDDPGHRHHDLLADRALPETREYVHKRGEKKKPARSPW